MIRSLFTASTGMNAQDLNVSVIANNLANVNTAGFKRSRPDFQDLVYQNLRLVSPELCPLCLPVSFPLLSGPQVSTPISKARAIGRISASSSRSSRL